MTKDEIRARLIAARQKGWHQVRALDLGGNEYIQGESFDAEDAIIELADELAAILSEQQAQIEALKQPPMDRSALMANLDGIEAMRKRKP